MNDKNYYITTAISYPNGEPHMGHAYEALSADALARFKRLDGYDVFFLTGTDEHGQKMQKTAEEEGIATIELADRNAGIFEEMVKFLNCSNDDFIRTTQERHKQAVTVLWDKMVETGDIYLDKYAGWYSVRDEAYYTESELVKQEDGSFLSAETGTPVEWVEEESYFFRLSAYQQKLLDHYAAQPEFIAPASRRNEVRNFVEGGLQDLSVSRNSFDWGVPVPGSEDHVMYVWVDALTNYITGIDYPDTESEQFKKFWPADVHIIGKDITRFHAIYWPAFLMSANLPLPKRIFGHGHLNYNGAKMSKSTGNVVSPRELVDQYGVDAVRFYFLREVPYGNDGNFSHEAIRNRINADLANDLGNLAQRSLSMIFKNCEGSIPAIGDLQPQDEAMLALAEKMLEACRPHIDKQALHKVLEVIWNVVGEANKYFTAEEPWGLKKTDPARMGTVLYVTAETVRQVAIMSQPFMPDSCAKLLDQLEIPSNQRDFEALGTQNRLPSGTQINKPEGVFPRYVEPEDGEAS